MMCLYEGSKETVGSEWSEEFEDEVRVCRRSVLLLLFSVVVIVELPQTPDGDLRSACVARGRRAS